MSSRKFNEARSVQAAANFRARLEELGATLLEPQWLGSDKPHRVRCAEGHEGRPRPSAVMRGQGVCRVCANDGRRGKRMRGSKHNPMATEARFRARLDELGATLLDPWLGSSKKHRVHCAQGHECTPTPTTVICYKGGICSWCAGSGGNSKKSEDRFRASLDRLGLILLEDRYLGACRKHLIRCAKGHECLVTANHIISKAVKGCPGCAGKVSEIEKAAFQATLSAWGATAIDAEWRGSSVYHRIRCVRGHESHVKPTDLKSPNKKKYSPCTVCSRQRNSDWAEANFLNLVYDAGATPLEGTWRGGNHPYRIRCAKEHITAPYPSNVVRGAGVCPACSGKDHDVVYVVADSDCNVKFGVSMGSGAQRLRQHAYRGFSEVLRLHTKLPSGVAWDVERAVKVALAMADIAPTQGREWFGPDALPVVLDIVDGWLPALTPSACDR